MKRAILTTVTLLTAFVSLSKAEDIRWGDEDLHRTSDGIYSVQLGEERLSNGKYRHHIVFRQKTDGDYMFYTFGHLSCNGVEPDNPNVEISLIGLSKDDYSMDDNNPNSHWVWGYCQHIR